MKKFFRITYYTGISIVFLLVALVGYTQTRSFRSTLQDYILSHYKSLFHGDLSIGNIEGNLITGIQLNNVSFRAGDTTLFSADRIEVTHDPVSLFFKRVSLGRVTIKNPSIQLYRTKSGAWNISEIMTSSSADTATSPWTIAAKNIELVNARVSLVDSVLLRRRARGLSDSPPQGVVDYARVILDSVNLDAGFQVKPSEVNLQIRLLSFALQSPNLHLRHFQGDFTLTKNEVAVTNVQFRTDKSSVRLGASLSRLDVTKLRDLAELRSKPVQLSLYANDLNTGELKEFLYPWVDFLDKDLTLDVRAEGEFGRLNVQTAMVKTPQSTIDFSGLISNLHHPQDLKLDLVAANSVVDPADISAHVPGLSLPDLSEFGTMRFRLTFNGMPTDFQSSVKASTAAGDIAADAHLTISDVLQYSASFKTIGLNLAELTANSDLESNLDLNGTVTGSGTDPQSASAVARVEVDSSEFWGMPIGKSAFVFDLNNAVLRAHTQLRARSALYELSGILRFPRSDSVSYTLSGSINGLNLADIIRNNQFDSDLSFAVAAHGNGDDIRKLHHAMTIDFARSSFGGVPFEKGGIQALFDATDDSHNLFSFRSAPIDIDVDGRFTLVSLVENILYGEGIVNDAIVHRFQTLDSLRTTTGSSGLVAGYKVFSGVRPKYVDFSYRVQAKNLFPVGVFFGKNLSGALSMDGSVKGNVDSLDFGGKAEVQSFVYKDQSDSYGLDNGTLSVNLRNISREGLLQTLGADLNLRSDRFFVNNLSFGQTTLALASDRDSASYQWSALIDSLYQVDLRGASVYNSNQYALDLSQLRVGMDFYIFENTDPIQMRLGRDGLYVDNLSMAHEIEEVALKGYFDPGGNSDLNVTVNDFLLNNLSSILRGTRTAESVRGINGILNASFGLKGSLRDPDVLLDLTANGLRSHDIVLGQVVGKASYTNHVLNLFVELRNRQNEQDSKPDLLISGTVPYDFRRISSAGSQSNDEINLTMYSKGLNLEFLDPLIPTVSNLTGTLVCDMKIRGTIDDPSYDGSISIQGAKFYFKPLGISYLAQGRLVPSGNRVALENFMVRNIPQDRPDGQMKFTGTMSLSGVQLRDFDLRADGQLLVMKESSRLQGEKFYGDLFLGTGPGGVRWRGQPSDSRVSGDVVVKNGRITFPPEHEVTSLANSQVNVIFRNDTLKAKSTPEEMNGSAETSTSNPYLSLVSNKLPDGGTGSMPDATSDPASPDDSSRSFLDNISYDLNIDVQSPTSLLFIFNTQLNEELFADLNGKLTFSKNSSQTRLTGEMDLESRSYYNFFKRFDAAGKIDFTGDPLNPELDVTAKYEGIHMLDTAVTLTTNPPKNESGQVLTSERVDVILHVTGTKNKPKTKFELQFPDRDKNSQYVSKDPDADAMSFLVTGFLKDELSPNQGGSYLTANMLSGLTSGLITGPLTNALKKQISAIQSVDLQYYAGDWNKTDVRVTAAISSAIIRFNGRVIEGINNTNVSVEVPVGSVFGSDRLRNLLLKYERKVDAVESVEQRAQSNSLSLFYRIIF